MSHSLSTADANRDIPRIPLLINGEYVQSRTTEWRDVINPATQQRLARVPLATAGRGGRRDRRSP